MLRHSPPTAPSLRDQLDRAVDRNAHLVVRLRTLQREFHRTAGHTGHFAVCPADGCRETVKLLTKD